MELTIIQNVADTYDLPDIVTESFISEGILYNASYVPTDNSVATIMLERVVKYPEENIYFKNRINMINITVVNSSHIKITSASDLEKSYEVALAAATAAYKFDLVKNYLTVDMENNSLPIHISLSNR